MQHSHILSVHTFLLMNGSSAKMWMQHLFLIRGNMAPW